MADMPAATLGFRVCREVEREVCPRLRGRRPPRPKAWWPAPH